MRNSKKRVGVYKWKVASRELILSNVTGSTVHHGKLAHCSQKQSLNAGFGLPKSLSKERLQVYSYTVYSASFFFFFNRQQELHFEIGWELWDFIVLMSFIWTLCSTKAHLIITLDFFSLWLIFFKDWEPSDWQILLKSLSKSPSTL